MKRTLTLLALVAGVAVPAALAGPAGMPNGRLVDQSGMTLYFYSMDSHITSNCEGDCTAKWPPLLASVSDSGAGTYDIMQRRDGRLQWAWHRHPLYRYVGDSKPGDANGDGFGDKWHEVTSFWP